MDHEAVPRPCEICDWLLNLSWDHFGLHQRKDVRWTLEFEVPKRHIVRPTTNMGQWVLRWERQKRCSSRKTHGPMTKKCCYNQFLSIFFWGVGKRRWRQEKTRENKRMIKHDFFFQIFFWAYVKKSIIFIFGHSSWSTFGTHLARGPKAL